ncbi:M23 family metallopeptidase (plasmid) [Bosea vestrisii]|uniref:M23 family metallopeptidase n=1 Tax=Bosea vestrisii TaxID=151416 RepID=UPI0024DF38F7|nr:M23 family metallopeptidase [Bosea vestrisii]WID99688.1 M23 family metallopeptidase [Bosea vestrisii]
MAFPLAFVPSQSWKTGIRRFGAYRTRTRVHAGCDLYAPDGTPMHAVADGEIIIFRLFYKNAWAVTVDHGDFIVRYGECKPQLPAGLRVGSVVYKRQVIGWVTKMTGIVNTMIHFEMYDKTASGELSNGSAPYNRRKDLVDPTPFLDRWSLELPPSP